MCSYYFLLEQSTSLANCWSLSLAGRALEERRSQLSGASVFMNLYLYMEYNLRNIITGFMGQFLILTH